MLSVGMAFLRLWKGLRTGLADPVFRALLIGLLAMISGATVFYRSVEGWGWIDCAYFAVMTLTTNTPHGFAVSGDFAKLFTMLYVFTGTGVMITFAITFGRHIVGVAEATGGDMSSGPRRP